MKFIIFAALLAVAAATYIKTPVSSEETTSDELASSEMTQYPTAYSTARYSTTTGQADEEDNEDDDNTSDADAENEIESTSPIYTTHSYTIPSTAAYRPTTYPKY